MPLVNVELDEISRALLDAQSKAEDLFAAVIDLDLIAAGKLESEVSADIHALAQSRFGVSRHWHKRIARAGPNTLLTYQDNPKDRRIEDDDIVYLDFGPVFEAWEADFGRTYALGGDPAKHKLVADIETAFHRGKAHFQDNPDLTCGELYDYVVGLASAAGWEFGNHAAGHLVGHFPHETAPGEPKPLSIRHGNELPLRARDASGGQRHWILEIHFIDRARQIGGFFEELLTI
jgi:Xaa-Pro dipeptidase